MSHTCNITKIFNKKIQDSIVFKGIYKLIILLILQLSISLTFFNLYEK